MIKQMAKVLLIEPHQDILGKDRQKRGGGKDRREKS